MVIGKVLVIATAIIKNKQGKVLLLQRSNKGSYPDFWQPVEGKVDGEESPQDTIRREVNEETKLKVKNTEFNNVFINEIEAKGLKYLCFRTVFKTSVSNNTISTSDEHTTFGWFSKKEASKLPLLPGTEVIIKRV